tara:strand:+ start:122 stop:457 length:336 start_codon:yes stop_codon:yes gene_type:complete
MGALQYLGIKTVGLSNPEGTPSWVIGVEARLDTGASRSSIDEGFLALLRLDDLVVEDAIKVKSANGVSRRDTVVLVIIEGEEEIELEVSITDRAHMGYALILGRDYLGEIE